MDPRPVEHREEWALLLILTHFAIKRYSMLTWERGNWETFYPVVHVVIPQGFACLVVVAIQWIKQCKLWETFPVLDGRIVVSPHINEDNSLILNIKTNKGTKKVTILKFKWNNQKLRDYPWKTDIVAAFNLANGK